MSTLSTFSIISLVVCLLLLLSSIVLCFLRKRWAVAVAFVGMAGLDLTLLHTLTSGDLFWGIAALIALGIVYMIPAAVAASGQGVGYIVGGVVVGAFVGLIVSHSWMVVGAVVGGVLGGIAYSRTPRGSEMGFPSSRFFNYLCAKGLPAVVTICIAGTALETLLAYLRLGLG